MMRSPISAITSLPHTPMDRVRGYRPTPLPALPTRDPFDRIIVGQAALQQRTLVTKDCAMRDHYPYALWTSKGRGHRFSPHLRRLATCVLSYASTPKYHFEN